jgi:hypothetical protein
MKRLFHVGRCIRIDVMLAVRVPSLSGIVVAKDLEQKVVCDDSLSE